MTNVWATEDGEIEFQLHPPVDAEDAFNLVLLPPDLPDVAVEDEEQNTSFLFATNLVELDEMIGILQKVRTVITAPGFDGTKLPPPEEEEEEGEDDGEFEDEEESEEEGNE